MKTLIIGNGFCGAHLKNYVTNSDVAELPQNASSNCIAFDLTNEEHWPLFSQYQNIIITCKLEDESIAHKLSKALKNKFVVLLSTAKAFEVKSTNELINEDFPLRMNSRNSAESNFLESGSILHLGLIWGKGRQPEKWFRQERIKNGNKLVNLIHVDDICSIVNYLITEQINVGRLLISDGKPLRWQAIADCFNIQLPSKETGIESKRFNTKKLRSLLPTTYKFKNLLN